MLDSEKGIERIATERKRQINEEGYCLTKDDYYKKEELVMAAVCYAMPNELKRKMVNLSPSTSSSLLSIVWPWDIAYWKPTKDRIRELEKAGALIAAEIDRLLRLKTENAK